MNVKELCFHGFVVCFHYFEIKIEKDINISNMARKRNPNDPDT